MVAPPDPVADPTADPTADPDGDGLSNAEEGIAGTDPGNQLSVFTIHVEPGSGYNRLFWEGRLDRIYTIRSSPGLAVPFTVVADDIAGEEPLTEYIDTNVTSNGQIFYKGEVRLK